MDSSSSSRDDAISLHTINVDFRSESPDRTSGSQSPSTPTHPTHETDDSTIPPIFKQCVDVVRSPPVFSSPTWGHWEPKLDMVVNKKSIIIFLCVCIFFHEVTIATTSVSTALGFGNDVFPLTATILLCGITWIYGRRSHLVNQLMRGDLRSGRTDLGGGALWIICTIGPLLSLPIMQFHSFSNHPVIKKGIDCATLSSWSDVARNIGGSLPAALAARDIDSAGADFEWDSSDLWLVKDVALTQLNQMAFTNVASHGLGPDEKIWNGINSGYGQGVYMPVMPLTGSYTSHMTLQSELQANSEILAMSLRCELIKPSDQPKLEELGGETVLSVSFVDSEGCSDTLSLPPLTFDENLRKVFSTYLWKMESSAQETADKRLKRAWLQLIDDYRELQLSKEVLVAYTPTWRRFSSDSSSRRCREKFAMVALTDGAFLKNSTPRASQIQVTTCSTQFFTTDIEMWLGHKTNDDFHSPIRFESQDSYNRFHNVTPYSRRTSSLQPDDKGAEFSPEWKELDHDAHGQFSELFLQQISSTKIPGNLWPFTQLREQCGTLIWDRPRPVASLLMVGKILRQSFIAKISAAAGLTLQEEINKNSQQMGNSSLHRIQGRLLVQRQIKNDVVQKRIAFRVLLYFCVICFTIAVVFPGNEVIKNRDVIPWAVTSIAARAAMLHHSPLQKWLSDYRLELIPAKISKRMRLGVWRVHEKQGHSGWRLDWPAADLPELRTESGERRQLNDDIIANIYMRKLGTWLGALLVVYGILPWVPTGWNKTVSAERQLLHVLGVFNIRIDRSSWSLLLQRVLPNALLFFATYFWIPRLYYFIRLRQPWVALKQPQPAQKSITLDYYNSNFPILSAIKNRHWLLAFLATGYAFGLFAPFIQESLHSWEVLDLQKKDIEAQRPWDWTERITFPQDETQPRFNIALKGMMDSLVNSENLPFFSSTDVGVIGVDRSNTKEEGSANLWSYNTSALRPHLDCEEISMTTDVQYQSSISTKGARVEWLRTSKNDQQYHGQLHLPCSSGRESSIKPSEDSDEAHLTNLTCARWWLDSPINLDDQQGFRWLIASVKGEGYWSAKSQEMIYTGDLSVRGLSCFPKIVKEEGRAILYSEDKDIKTAKIVKYEPSRAGGVHVDSGMVNAISQGLNGSNSLLDGFNGGIIAEDNIINTGSFAGDFLGYIMYRFICQAKPSCLDGAHLKKDVSRIFSLYVSVVAGQSNMLRIIIPSEKVEMTPFQFVESTKVHWGPALLLALFFIFCVVLAVFARLRQQAYSLPLSPELFLNSLLLLCGSALVSTMERKIDRPDDLTLKELHDKIESWGFTYKLGWKGVRGEAAPVVDEIGEFDSEDLDPQGYRDNPSSGSQERNT